MNHWNDFSNCFLSEAHLRLVCRLILSFPRPRLSVDLLFHQRSEAVRGSQTEKITLQLTLQPHITDSIGA